MADGRDNLVSEVGEPGEESFLWAFPILYESIPSRRIERADDRANNALRTIIVARLSI
jgi:hypothetical protein